MLNLHHLTLVILFVACSVAGEQSSGHFPAINNLQTAQDSPQSAEEKEKAATTSEISFPPLPFAITSFGAASIDHTFYVYGGHTGDAHAYCNEDQNHKLLSLDTAVESPQWKEIATDTPLQGLAMVAHGDDLVIIGGFTALNKRGEKANLQSRSDVRAFNIKTGQWRDLPAIPDPRSSHDAAIIGDTIYVVGGWNMQGPKSTTWHTTAWSLNLAEAKPVWKEMTTPPFTRRAVAAIAHEGQLFVVGGMNQNGGPTKEAEKYDPQSATWSDASSIIGQTDMAGFGVSGWSVAGNLYVTTHEGEVIRWSPQTKEWLKVKSAQEARFFHRNLITPSGLLVSIGGANMEQGKYTSLETIALP